MRLFFIILFLALTFTSIKGQNNQSSKSRNYTKFEFQPGMLGNIGLITPSYGFAYNFNNRVSLSLGPLIGFPFSNGGGILTGLNLKIIGTHKFILSADFIYRLNSGRSAGSDGGGVDSSIINYTVPSAQFVVPGLSFDFGFKDNTRLRVTFAYNFALDEYKPKLEQGVANKSEEDLINLSLKNSVGLHFIYVVPMGG